MSGKYRLHQGYRAIIASSRENRSIAECIQLGLEDEIETAIWSQGAFGLSSCTLEDVTHAVQDSHFAIVVISAEDLGAASRQPALFEIGLAVGVLGRDRTFIVCSRRELVDLPTNLAGAMATTFTPSEDGDLRAALNPVCTKLKLEIQKAVGASAQFPMGGTTRSVDAYAARRRRRRSLGTAWAGRLNKDYGIVDISSSGALLETDGEIEVGRELDLDLDLDRTTKARVTARVVRVQRPTWGLVGGVGVAFTQCEESSRQAIEQYVDADPEERSARGVE